MRNIGASDATLEPIMARFGISDPQHLMLLAGYYMTICRLTLTLGVAADAPPTDVASAVMIGREG